MKEKIEKQNIHGKVYIWKYLENSRNYPGWNFTVDKMGAESLLLLLDLMKRCEWSSKKEIQISRPTENQLQVPNNRNGSAKWETVPKLVLNSKKYEEEDFWKIIEKEDEIEIQFGKDKLIEFEEAISEITKGNGDFGISNNTRDNILFMWWNTEK